MEKDLAQAGARTLMWSLDGALRYIPIAALHVASHFRLNPGEFGLSYLLLGDGTTLSMADFDANPALELFDVELLTLSACE